MGFLPESILRKDLWLSWVDILSPLNMTVGEVKAMACWRDTSDHERIIETTVVSSLILVGSNINLLVGRNKSQLQ